MQAPKNLRLVKYLCGSAEIAWDGVLFHNQKFIVQCLNPSLNNWEDIEQLTNNAAIIYGPYSAARIVVTDNISISEPSNVITLAQTNASNINMPVVVGKDDAGQARFLSTTAEGVLRVTGATVNNYGGDASAANQSTQIAQMSDMANALSQLIDALNAIVSKLDNAGLKSSIISALKLVDVNNLPSDYPDAAALSAIDALTSIVAKSDELLSLISIAGSLLRPVDLSLNSDKSVNAVVNNLPSDYPDASATALLDGISTSAAAISAALSNVTEIVENISDTGLLQLENLSDANTSLLNAVSSLLDIESQVSDVIAGIKGLDDLLSGLMSYSENTNSHVVNLSRLADLNLDSENNLNTNIVNLPSDYPDSNALSELELIREELILISQGIDVNIINPLPEGNNKIGSVDVLNMPLPDNAALESTQLDIHAKITYQSRMLSLIKHLIGKIDARVDALAINLQKRFRPRSEILDVIVELPNQCESVKLSQICGDKAINKLSAFSKYNILILSYAAAFDVSALICDFHLGQPFEHVLQNACLNTCSSAIVKLSIPIDAVSLRFQKTIDASNTHSVARVVIYGES